jgi:hypothetical protein
VVRRPKEGPKKDQRRIKEGSKKDQRRTKEGQKNSQMSAAEATHLGSVIAFKHAVVDLRSALININSSALEVACPPPGHRGKFRKFLLTVIYVLTASAVLLSKMQV